MQKPRLFIVLLAFFHFLAAGGRANDSVHWYQEFDQNSCQWLMLRAAREPLFLTQVQGAEKRLAKRIDQMAKSLLGHSRRPISEIQLLKPHDLPSYDARELEKAARNLKPRYRQAFRDFFHPDVPAFQHVQWDLINTRIAEIRTETDAANDVAENFFYEGERCSGMFYVTTVPEQYQADLLFYTLADNLSGTPMLLDIWWEHPIRCGDLRKRADVIRAGDRMMPEPSPYTAEGRLHFNAGHVVYVGGLNSLRSGDRAELISLGIIANDSLSYEGRHSVTLHLPLDGIIDTKSPELPLPVGRRYYAYSGIALPAMTKLGSQATEEQMRVMVRNMLTDIALEITKERPFQLHDSSPLLPEFSVISPRDPLSLNYNFVFRRKDGKNIQIRFTGPDNYLKYAKHVVELGGESP